MITPLAPALVAAPLKGVEILILDAQTVDETVSTVVAPSSGIKNHTVTIKTSASVTGVVTVEIANDVAYAGTWYPLIAYDLSTVGAAHEQLYQFSNIAITALRVRISTVVAGGSVSASYLGN